MPKDFILYALFGGHFCFAACKRLKRLKRLSVFFRKHTYEG